MESADATNDNLTAFGQQLESRLDAVERHRNDQQTELALEMAMLTVRHEEFAALSERLIAQLLLPRVRMLAERFGNAEVVHAPGQHCVRCRFRHTVRFPATVELVLGVTHDERVELVSLFYDLSILPVFLKFKKHDQVSWRLEDFRENEFKEWLEAQLIEFLDTYLRIEEVDQYHQETLCTDPVCGMRIRKSAAAASLEHKGKTLYFCVDACREAFVQEPSRYVGQ